MALDLLVLDFSGVVSYDLPVVYGSWTNIFNQFGKKIPSRDDCLKQYRANVFDFYAEHGIHDIPTIKKMHQAWLETHKPDAIPGAPEIVAELAKRVPVAIFSSHPEVAVHDDLDRFGIAHAPHYVFGDMNKATPDGFNKLLKISGARPHRTAYAGDTSADLWLAGLMGVESVAVVSEYGYQTLEFIKAYQPGPTKGIINHIRELVPLLDSF